MKKNALRLSAVLLCGALAFTSCKKKSDANPDDTGTQTTTAQDQTDYARETNQTAIDADAVLSGSGSTNARMSGVIASNAPSPTITGATVDYTKATNGVYVITYTDTTAAGTVRKGSVSITVSPSGAKWDSAGTQVILASSYTVTKANGKTMSIVGVDTLTKVSVGDYTRLINSASGQYQVSHVGVDTVTFDNGTTRKWQHSRLKTFSYTSPMLTISVAGSGNADGLTDVDTWGINRVGDAFYSEIKTPIQWVFNPSAPRSVCSHWFDPISGVYFHKGVGDGLTVTYGVGIKGGAPVIADCPYGFELQWTFNGKQETAIIPY